MVLADGGALYFTIQKYPTRRVYCEIIEVVFMEFRHAKWTDNCLLLSSLLLNLIFNDFTTKSRSLRSQSKIQQLCGFKISSKAIYSLKISSKFMYISP